MKPKQVLPLSFLKSNPSLNLQLFMLSTISFTDHGTVPRICSPAKGKGSKCYKLLKVAGYI